MAGTNFFTNISATCWIALTEETIGVNGEYAMLAKCTGTPPTTANVFEHGCIMIQTDSFTGEGAVYQNTGSRVVPVWSLFDSTISVASLYSLGLGAGYAATTTSSLTLTKPQKFTTGNIGQATLVGTPSFGTGSNLGTTGLTAALADVASLYALLKAKTGTAIITPSAIEGDNYGYGTGVFVPGVYTTASGINVTASKTITLNGAGDYVFVSTGGAITFGATDVISLTNGADASRVYWVANNAITSGSTDTLKGNFMSGADITIGSTNNIEGRLLSAGATTIDGTATSIYLPFDYAAPTPSPTPTTTSTSSSSSSVTTSSTSTT